MRVPKTALTILGLCLLAGCPWPDPDPTVLAVDTSPVKGEVFVEGESWGIAPQSRDLPPSVYVVAYGDVAGYVAPPSTTVELTEGEQESVVGVYRKEGPITDLAKAVAEWAGEVEGPAAKQEAAALAVNYGKVASEIDALSTVTRADAIRAVAALNRSDLGARTDAWLPFFQNLAAAMDELERTGELSTVFQAAERFREIALGLEEVSQ